MRPPRRRRKPALVPLAFALGLALGCAERSGSRARAPRAAPKAALRVPTRLAMGSDFLCRLDADGVRCTGQIALLHGGSSEPLPKHVNLERVFEIRAGMSHACALV